jgi:hypothetical protein
MLGISGLRRTAWAAIALILPPAAIGAAVLVVLF